jgi:hypothetical protein
MSTGNSKLMKSVTKMADMDGDMDQVSHCSMLPWPAMVVMLMRV